MALVGIAQAKFTSSDVARGASLCLLILAFAFPVFALTGWLLDVALLRGLGDPTHSIMPLVAVLFLLIDTGALLAHFGKIGAARAVISVPLALLLLLALRYATGLDLGLERLFFPNQVAALGVTNRGMPGTGGITVLLIESVAVLLVSSDSPIRRGAALVLASTSVGLAVLITAIVLFGSTHAPPPTFISRATMVTLPVFALSASMLLDLLNKVRDEHLGFEYNLLSKLSPAIIVLPVLPSLLALLTVGSNILSVNQSQFVVVAGNILIVSLMLGIGLHSARKHSHGVRAREAQLRAILAGVPDAVIVTDPLGWVKDFSLAAGRLWGVPEDTLPHCNMATYLGEKEQKRFAELLERREPEFLLTGAGVRTDGSRFPLELRGMLFQGLDDETCFTLFARDLSDTRAAQQHVARLGAEVALASRHTAMGELAIDLGHELNQPLTAAINYLSTVAYLLDQRGDDGHAPEMVDEARSQLARAGEIIRRTRDFAQKRDVEKRVEPLAPMVEDAIRLVLVGSGGHDIDIETALDPGDIAVFVDRIQVQQVLVNLLRNAVEVICSAGQHPGRIVISAHAGAPGWVEVALCDNGPGVPEAILGQLFERFTSTKADAGMGIGLSISRRIVEAHGGKMRAVNPEDGGATFQFTLPAATAATRG